jgi:hypothetical protein
MASFTGYNVYRDDLKIANNISPLLYNDLNLPEGLYSYKVSAQYLEGESGFAGPVSVLIALCTAPSDGTATNLTTVGADLNWTENGTATAWDIEVVDFGVTPTGAPTFTNVSKPYTVTTLNSATKYSFYVRSRCSGTEFSIWSGPYTFTTLCDSYTVPLTQNFDSYLVGEIPTCWSTAPTVANAWRVADNVGAYSLPNSMVTYYNSAVAKDDWFFSPALTLIGGKSYDVSFMVEAPGWDVYPEALEVKWGTDASVAGMTGGTIFTDANMFISTFTLKSGSFTPVTSGTYYIGWHAFSEADVDYIAVDDISILATPTCMVPTALTATNIGTTQADLAWTQTGTPESWDIEYGTDGYLFTGTPTISGITNPYTLMSITASSSYTYKVRANCGSGDFSAWSAPYTFSTACDPIGLPWVENFDAVTAPAIPACMTVTNDNGDGVQ